MASWHTILSCSYDLASNIRGVQLAAKKVSLLVANFGDTCEWLSASLEAYSEAQNNLLISLTNFGTWVSYHIPTTLIGYPAQVREYAVHHGEGQIRTSLLFGWSRCNAAIICVSCRSKAHCPLQRTCHVVDVHVVQHLLHHWNTDHLDSHAYAGQGVCKESGQGDQASQERSYQRRLLALCQIPC